MNKKIAMFLILVLSVAVISGCVQQEEGGIDVKDVTSGEEAGEVTGDMTDEIEDLAAEISGIDEDLTG